MTHQYNAETRNILHDWINALKQKITLDKFLITRLEELVDSTEIGHPEKIHELIESLEDRE